MFEQRYCDFCGCSETELIDHTPSGSSKLDIDPDGLWVCGECQSRLVTKPVGELEAADLDEELLSLVGRSAGAICYTLNLPYEPPYQSIIDAASSLAYDEDRFMSTWSFVTQWLDGSTVWRAEDGLETAVVSGDGSIDVQ